MRTTALFILLAVILGACGDYDARPTYDQRDRLVGYYEVEEFSRTYREYVSYEVFVSKNPYASREIYIQDFYAVDTEVVALVDYGRITIPLQVTRGYEIEGSGWISGNELHLDYRVRDLYDHGYVDYCEATLYHHY